jgi:hypothetical protein
LILANGIRKIGGVMMPEFHAFISHKTEDRPIAELLKKSIEWLSHEQLRIHYSGEIPYGTNWREWIERQLIKSQILIFLYTTTGKDTDWLWCFYEIGIFRGNRIGKTRVCETKNGEDSLSNNILGIKHPSIQNPPTQIEDIQFCDADVAGITELFSQLLYDKCVFSEKPLVANKDPDRLGVEVKSIVRALKPPVEIKYFDKRLCLTMSKFEDETIKEYTLDNSPVSGNDITMRFLNLPPDGTKWHSLYSQFKLRGENTWLDQIGESIERIKMQTEPFESLQPFKKPNGETFIPIITRIETFRVIEADTERIIPMQLFVIFTRMPQVTVPSYTLIDMSELTQKWTNYPPTSVVKIRWKQRKSITSYHADDIIEEPYVCAANEKFADLWDFKYQDYFPNPNDEPGRRLTDPILMEFVKDCIDPVNLEKLSKDQERLAKRIIFDLKDDLAEIPLQFNNRHNMPEYRNQAYLPYLVSKHIVGDYSGPHDMYLLVCYIKDFLPLDGSEGQ